MTMVPMWKKCPKCHKKYAWNPDVGNFNCPYCHGLGKSESGILGKIFEIKNKFLDNEKLIEAEDLDSEK